MIDNDLTELLHEVDYPVNACHSAEDYDVSIATVPNFTENSDFLIFEQVTGGHGNSISFCALSTAHYLQTVDFNSCSASPP